VCIRGPDAGGGGLICRLQRSIDRLALWLMVVDSEGATNCNRIRDDIEGSTSLKFSYCYYLKNKATKRGKTYILEYTQSATHMAM
jgi:hypothetical protein